MSQRESLPDHSAPIEAHETPTPGPKVYVTLRLGEPSLSELLEGAKVERMWLTEEEPGIYELHANRTLGEARKGDVKPSIDTLVELLNGFVGVLDSYEDEIPQPVGEAWDRLIDQWNAYGRKSAASDETSAKEEGA